MVWNDLLPIGSIVLLKEADPTARLQIIGYAQVSAESKKLYDYNAVFYPQGYVDGKSVVMFNHEDIEKIYAIGYMTEASRENIEYVKGVLDDVRGGRVSLQDKIDESEALFGKVIK